MINELNLTKYLKTQFRRRPKVERCETFKQWMRSTVQCWTHVSQTNVNASDAARAWCDRKGVKA
jgi:hypothetical protein